jgi:NAD(P)-dependent dehydrogenase (short-subunit alcohol dehydrogenase family)
MNINKKFPQKRVLITGAGSGLGRALALEFAEMNWNIAIAEINRERGQESAQLVNKAGGNALYIPCDVTMPEDFVTALAMLQQQWGGVDILINNAGITAGGYMEKISLEDWERIITINMKSLIYGCRAVIPEFKKHKSGYIINVASSAGLVCIPECISYNMTKAAVIAMSETLRAELSPDNIGVSVVCPTFFKTNLMDQFTSTDERQRKLAQRFFDKASTSAQVVAQHVIKSIECGRFYIIAQMDGKFMWYMKRQFPEIFLKATCLIYRKGFYYKYLGFKPDELQ